MSNITEVLALLDDIKQECLTAGAQGQRNSAKAFAHIARLCLEASVALDNTPMAQYAEQERCLGNATFAAMDFDINRYLIASRRNGAEKAERHRALTETFLRVYAKNWQRRDRAIYTAIHDATQEMTNHLDRIGLKADGYYDDDVPRRFHDEFIRLAHAELAKTDRSIAEPHYREKTND